MVAAALENCVLEEYSKRMKSKILAPSKEVQDTICTFFSMFKVEQKLLLDKLLLQ